MIICTISVGLNFDMCNMLAELIETMQVVTDKYREICCEKKVMTKFHTRF